MSDILSKIVADKKIELAERKRLCPQDQLVARLPQSEQSTLAVRSFKGALQTKGSKIIAEIKRRSPSAGELAKELDIEYTVKCYSRYAQAISVVTDEKYFGGSLSMISQIKSLTTLPVLMKDFVFDQYQVHEARSAGADALLLIAKILDYKTLGDLYYRCLELGMCPVVEVQDEKELACAVDIDAGVVLINNRNLRSFKVDFDTTKELAGKLKPDMIGICASGIESRTDIEELLPYASCFLIGSALMRASNIEEKLRELQEESRGAVSCQT